MVRVLGGGAFWIQHYPVRFEIQRPSTRRRRRFDAGVFFLILLGCVGISRCLVSKCRGSFAILLILTIRLHIVQNLNLDRQQHSIMPVLPHTLAFIDPRPSLIPPHAGYLLEDGAPFDSSYERRRPFSFRVGGGDVIRGWDEAVRSMRVGGRRIVIIPPALGYGAGGAGGGRIPGGATLVFFLELLSIAP